MKIFEATLHQKRKWIEDGEHIDLLVNDKNGWIKIAAVKRRMVINEENRKADIDKLKIGMDADLFEVIQLGAKSDEQIYELIAENKYLTYFANSDKLNIRVRAKKRMREYLEGLEQTRRIWKTFTQ